MRRLAPRCSRRRPLRLSPDAAGDGVGERPQRPFEVFAVEGVDEIVELVVIDLHRVARADPGGLAFLNAFARTLEAQGGKLAIAGCEMALEQGSDAEPMLMFEDLDRAVEWCENELLDRVGCGAVATSVALADHELLAGLTGHELERLLPDLRLNDIGLGGLPLKRRHLFCHGD